MNTHKEQIELGNKFIGLYVDQEIHAKLKADCALKNESIKKRIMRLIENDLKRHKIKKCRQQNE